MLPINVKKDVLISMAFPFPALKEPNTATKCVNLFFIEFGSKN